MTTVRHRTNHAHRAASCARVVASTRGVLALVLGAFTAACQDATSPADEMKPQFAQGDGGVWTVNSAADPGSAGCDDAECTLREAIAAATSGGTIVFAPAITGPIQLSAGMLHVNKSLTIIGPGATVLSVQGQLAENTVFYVYDGLSTQAQVEISGLTITGGAAYAVGGGVHNLESLTLSSVVVANNDAPNRGGGIYTVDGELTLLNTAVFGNGAGEGGGIAAVNSQVTLIGSTLTGNSAVSTWGGGIWIGGGGLTVLRTTVSGNFAELGGEGITSAVASSIRSSTIADHIYAADGAIMTIANAIVGNGCLKGAAASLTSLGHNVLVACDPIAIPTDVVLTDAQLLFSEVLESELKDNGGPTRTHALLARGRAVDAGYCPGETEDQRGSTVPVDDPIMPNALDGCDIGAYELQGPFVPVADLMVSQAVDRTSVKQGELLTYSIRVQNLGPETAPNVVMNDVLSSGVTFVEARSSKGNFTAPNKGETGTVTWYLGDMLDQANEVAEIVVTVLVKGKTTITNTASVTGDVADPNGANNTASMTVSVAAGGGTGGKKK